jgi:hypothetical protein
MNRIFPSIICLFLLASCGTAQTSLPKKWSDDMTLTFYTGPGMQPDSYTTEIRAGKCMHVSKDGHKVDTSYFKLSQAQLDKIATIMYQYKFDEMKDDPTPGIVYDKRTSTITFTIGEKVFSITDSASLQINEKYWESLSKMRAEIRSIVNTANKREIL